MSILEAIFLGIVQGLTEFLPVSSSGHLVIAKELLGVESAGVTLEVILHAATVLSTIVVFWSEVSKLVGGFFKFKLNDETLYLLKIGVSMIPVFIVGVFFKSSVEALFTDGLAVVGVALLVTSLLLMLSTVIKPKERGITFNNAYIIGVAQAAAVIPGLSRSGATIATGLMAGVSRDEVAKFSFLMVLVPILGEAFLELVSGELALESSGIALLPLVAGFLAAFITGLFACKAMIALVKRAKLRGFAIYCALAGILSLVLLYMR